MTARRVLLLGLAGVLTLSGCIQSDVEIVSTGDAGEAGDGDTTPPGEEGPPMAPGARLETARMGEAVVTAGGNVVTVHRFDAPIDVPDPDLDLSAAEVEACARDDGDGASVAPEAFRLQLTGGSRRHPVAVDAREPPLPSTRIDPGSCVQGWVVFPVRVGERPEAVVLLATTVVQWIIETPD